MEWESHKQSFHSLKCFTSVPNCCPDMGIWPLLQFPHAPGIDPVLTLLFFFFSPSFLCPTEFCMVLFFFFFLVERYSGLLSAGVLQDLHWRSNQVYSWCIHAERCTPHSPTPLPTWISTRTVFEHKSRGFPNFPSHGRQIRSKISTGRDSSGGEKMLPYSHEFLIIWRLYSPLTFLKAEQHRN